MWPLCDVVLVSYVVVALTVMRVLLDVSILRECKYDGTSYVVASHEYVVQVLCLAQLTC